MFLYPNAKSFSRTDGNILLHSFFGGVVWKCNQPLFIPENLHFHLRERRRRDHVTLSQSLLGFANHRHLLRHYDVKISSNGRVPNAGVCSVLLYRCDSQPTGEDLGRLSMFDHWCLWSLTRVWWRHRVNSDRVRRKIFATDRASPRRAASLCLDEVLRMPTLRLPHRAQFTIIDRDLKRRRGGEPMAWRKF